MHTGHEAKGKPNKKVKLQGEEIYDKYSQFNENNSKHKMSDKKEEEAKSMKRLKVKCQEIAKYHYARIIFILDVFFLLVVKSTDCRQFMQIIYK